MRTATLFSAWQQPTFVFHHQHSYSFPAPPNLEGGRSSGIGGGRGWQRQHRVQRNYCDCGESPRSWHSSTLGPRACYSFPARGAPISHSPLLGSCTSHTSSTQSSSLRPRATLTIVRAGPAFATMEITEPGRGEEKEEEREDGLDERRTCVVAGLELPSLLEVLGLTEAEVVAALSKKNQALMRIEVEGGEIEREQEGGGSEGKIGGNRSTAPWVMMDELKMTPKEVGLVIKRYPILLTQGAEGARLVLRWLVERVGLSRRQIVKVVKSHPRTLRYSVEQHLEPHAVWLEEVGLGEDGIIKVISKAPQMLGTSVEDNLKPKTTWLRDIVGVSEAGIVYMLKAFPSILGLSVENMDRKVNWLQARLKVDRTGVAKIFRMSPSLLGSSVDSGLEKKLVWLSDRLGLNQADLGIVVRACPSILGYSVDDNLEPTLEWLLTRLRMDMKGAATFIRQFPHILGLSPENNLEPKLAWLMENLALDEGQAIRLTKICPHVFGCSVKTNLQPTLEFFRGELGGSLDDVRGTVMGAPNLLRYSLMNRMIPRAEAIRKAGIGPLVFRDHVRQVTSWTSVKFDKWLDKEVQERGLEPSKRFDGE